MRLRVSLPDPRPETEPLRAALTMDIHCDPSDAAEASDSTTSAIELLVDAVFDIAHLCEERRLASLSAGPAPSTTTLTLSELVTEGVLDSTLFNVAMIRVLAVDPSRFKQQAKDDPSQGPGVLDCFSIIVQVGRQLKCTS